MSLKDGRCLGEDESEGPRACTVQEHSTDGLSTSSPFAMSRLGRRETTHIIYPDSPTDNVFLPKRNQDANRSSNLLTQLTTSFRDNLKKYSHRDGAQKFPGKCKAFFVELVKSQRKGEHWIASLDGVDPDFVESEIDGGWTCIDRVDAPGEDDLERLELELQDLEVRIDFSLDISADAVQKIREIGKGAFGQVFKAIYKNKLVVQKEVAPYHYGTPDGPRFIEALKAELSVLGALEPHPNVLTCYGGSMRRPNVFMLCQLMDRTLADLIYNQPDGPTPLSPDLALYITRDILAGLNHLHTNTPKIVHRDLKPENILLNKHNRACVADFGLSRLKSHTYIRTEDAHAGTPEYLAPEVATGHLDEKMDIYSVGVILWECLMAQRPWEGYHPFAIFLNVSKGQCLQLPENLFPTCNQGTSSISPSHFSLLSDSRRHKFAVSHKANY